MSEWNQKQLFGRVRDSARSMDPVIGTTVNTSIEVIDLDTRQFKDTEFIISNTGLNSLYYSTRVRSEYDDGADFTVFSNKVLSGEVDELILVRHARVLIDINSYTTDSHTTYSVSVIGGT
jgi:hypothetical protein